MEWTPVDAVPDVNGKYRVRLDNLSGVPWGVDEAKLIVNAANTMWRAQFAREVLGRSGGPAPPLKEGMVRTLFLRTVSCYEMPSRLK